MATNGSKNPTLLDWSQRTGADGKLQRVIEILSQNNEILADAPFLEGNMPTGHLTTMRSGLPDVAWRKINGGVQPSKSTVVKQTDTCGMLEAWCEIDEKLVELNGGESEAGANYRMSEATAFIEAMAQEHAATMFYGDTATSPEEFLGLAPRFNSLSAENAQNIIAGGGSGSDNTSVWLVGWGERTCHGIFPKGSKAGLVHNDLGIETVEKSDGSRLRAYRDQFKLETGLSLRDWRFVVRICNIDISALAAGSGADLIELMIKATHRIHNLKTCRPIFYVNRTVAQYLDIQANDKSNVYLKLGEEEGVQKTSFRTIPIHVVDSLLETEATVS